MNRFVLSLYTSNTLPWSIAVVSIVFAVAVQYEAQQQVDDAAAVIHESTKVIRILERRDTLMMQQIMVMHMECAECWNRQLLHRYYYGGQDSAAFHFTDNSNLQRLETVLASGLFPFIPGDYQTAIFYRPVAAGLTLNK